MTMPRPDEEAIFHAARDIADLDRRREYVREACRGDETLIGQIEAMLRVADAPDRLFDLAPAELLAGNDTQPAASEHDDMDLDFLTPSDKPGVLGRLGHYEVLEVIGQGGMGIVLRAFDDKLHRVVAIKVMATALAATSPPRKRFLREARAAAKVRHEHVVDIHAVEDQPIPYLVMEYVSGETLQQKLDRVGPLETAEVLRLGQQIARGLAAAHAQGLIHRDIKPSNILLEKGADERVKITDFGLARAADDVSLTQSGMIAGTPMYMAPEQTLGEAIDHRADLFSLGSVLYTMCSGRPPFRATTSMATLKRVAEDQPRPIREIIPEVPQWLCDIIARLHAKKPEERFESAKEAADLLGQCIQHLEHPMSAPMPACLAPLSPLGRGAGGEGRSQAATSTPFQDSGRGTQRRRRLAVAAAVLLCLIGGLSLTEATGVTSLRATVVRIFTPEGVLVVETDDPAVKVTVEGDGGLVITGAGLEEIRLRPGSYRVHADRDGNPLPLDKDLVTVARGGRAIVKVKLERAPALADAKVEQGAFVLLAAGKERKFNTLADAVQGASDGDTIEVRGNGPFETDGVEVRGRALTIRAAPGYRPVLALSARGREQDRPIVRGYSASLAMEGLTFQRFGSSPVATALIITEACPLRLANCRFMVKDNNTVAVWSHLSPTVDVRNCVFVGSRDAVLWLSPKEGTLSVDNCLLATSGGVGFNHAEQVQQVDVRLTRNTFAGGIAVTVAIHMVPDFFTAGSRPKAKRFRLEAENNLFAVTESTFRASQVAEAWREKPVAAGPFKTLVANLVEWRDRRNLYPPAVPFMAMQRPLPTGWGPLEPLVGSDRLDEWQQFAGPEAGALRGKAVFAGGDLWTQVIASPERLLPKQFALLPQSPGYRAGKDGKDLGADVDLVGPGEAYERWKKTPEYQQWLKDTGQKK